MWCGVVGCGAVWWGVLLDGCSATALLPQHLTAPHRIALHHHTALHSCSTAPHYYCHASSNWYHLRHHHTALHYCSTASHDDCLNRSTLHRITATAFARPRHKSAGPDYTSTHNYPRLQSRYRTAALRLTPPRALHRPPRRRHHFPARRASRFAARTCNQPREWHQYAINIQSTCNQLREWHQEWHTNWDWEVGSGVADYSSLRLALCCTWVRSLRYLFCALGPPSTTTRLHLGWVGRVGLGVVTFNVGTTLKIVEQPKQSA